MVNAEDKLMKLQVDRDRFETQLTVSCIAELLFPGYTGYELIYNLSRYSLSLYSLSLYRLSLDLGCLVTLNCKLNFLVFFVLSFCSNGLSLTCRKL